MEKDKNLYVRLFGPFEIIYEDKVITISKSENSQYLWILQSLTSYYPEGISREFLLAHLLKDVTFKYNREVPVLIDVEEFLKCTKRAEETKNTEEKIKLLLDASEWYRGGLLEESGVEAWVAVRSAQYKKLYSQSMRQLMDLLYEKKDYLRMLKVSSRAAAIYPYDEWQVEQIESLLILGEKKEAYHVYKRTARLYSEKFGIKMPMDMVERIRSCVQKVKDSFIE